MPIDPTSSDDRASDHEAALQAARRRLEVLSDITGRLLRIDALRPLADAVQDVLADELGVYAAGVALAEPGGLRYLSMRPYPPEVVAQWERFPMEAEVPATWALQHRCELWIDGYEEMAARFPTGSSTAAEFDLDSIGVVPLVASGAPIGVLTLAWQRGFRATDDDRHWCRALANVLTPAILRVQQNEADRHIAGVLQQGLLPGALPTPSWCDVGVSYRAAGEGQVGGDTYDVIELADDRLAAFVADVCGRGIEAASATSAIRHSLRAALIGGHDPVHALAIADQALTLGNADDLPLASAALVVLTRGDDGSHDARITLAGHPELVLVRDGRAQLVGHPGPLLGLGPGGGADRYELSVPLGSGDVLVLYTDGLTDTPRPRLSDAALLDLVASVPSHEPQIVASWLVGATGGSDGHRDDTALVILRPR